MDNETKTKKKPYVKPEMLIEEFTPNEYVSACKTEDGYTTYNFVCNAGEKNYWGYKEYNVYKNDGTKVNNGYFHACGTTHTVQVKDGDTVPFVEGYMDDPTTMENENIKVWIWGRPFINNTHCMSQLDSEHTAPYKNIS